MSCVFTPVPGAWGCNSLGCDQDQAPVLTLELSPQLCSATLSRAVRAQPPQQRCESQLGSEQGHSLRVPSSLYLCQAEPLSRWHSSPGAVVPGHKGGNSFPLGSFPQRQASACSAPSLSCCPGPVSWGCSGSWHPHGHVFPASQPPTPAESMGTESPTAKFLCGNNNNFVQPDSCLLGCGILLHS